MPSSSPLCGSAQAAGGDDQDGADQGQGRGRQPAAEIAVQRLHPVHHQGGAFADAARIGRAGGQQPGEGEVAQPGARRLPGGELGAFLRQAERRAEHGERRGGGQLRPARAGEAEQGGQQPGHQPGGAERCHGRRHAQQDGQHHTPTQGPGFALQQDLRRVRLASRGISHRASLCPANRPVTLRSVKLAGTSRQTVPDAAACSRPMAATPMPPGPAAPAMPGRAGRSSRSTSG